MKTMETDAIKLPMGGKSLWAGRLLRGMVNVLLGGLIGVALTACQNNDPESQPGMVHHYTAYATTAYASTAYATTAPVKRTELHGNKVDGFLVEWSWDDVFSLRYADDRSVATRFTLTDGAHSQVGTFETDCAESLSGYTFEAYYPATLEVAADGLITWPAVQAYSPVGCAVAPMVAKNVTLGEGNVFRELHFENAGGLLRLSTSQSADHYYLMKQLVFSASLGGSPVEYTISLPDEAIFRMGKSSYVYIALEAGDYADVKLSFTDYTGTTKTATLNGKTIPIEKSEITPVAVPVTNDLVLTAPTWSEYAGVRYANVDFADGMEFSWYALREGDDLVTRALGSDWRMPTQEEMLKIGDQLPHANQYWTSESQAGETDKAYLYCHDGDPAGCNPMTKSAAARVRAIYTGE